MNSLIAYQSTVTSSGFLSTFWLFNVIIIDIGGA